MKKQLTALALALSTVFAPMAATADAPVQEPTNASVQIEGQQLAFLDSQQALAQSAGQVLLHVGEGFSPSALDALTTQLENVGLEVEVATGGQEGMVTSYFFGNAFPPQGYTAEDSPALAALIIRAAQQYNLIASLETETPDNI